MGRLCLVHLLQLPQKGQQKGQRNEAGERIRNGLAKLHAHKSQHPGKYKDQRDKAHALSAAGQKGGAPGLANALGLVGVELCQPIADEMCIRDRARSTALAVTAKSNRK